MQSQKLSSVAMAAAAAMLFTSAISTTAFAADAATVKCEGVNSCKGTRSLRRCESQGCSREVSA